MLKFKKETFYKYSNFFFYSLNRAQKDMVTLDGHDAGKSETSCVLNPYFRDKHVLFNPLSSSYKNRENGSTPRGSSPYRPNEYFYELCCYKRKCSTSLWSCNATSGSSLHEEYYVAVVVWSARDGNRSRVISRVLMNSFWPSRYYQPVCETKKTTLLRTAARRAGYISG